jgi:hypothetical protein
MNNNIAGTLITHKAQEFLSRLATKFPVIRKQNLITGRDFPSKENKRIFSK